MRLYWCSFGRKSRRPPEIKTRRSPGLLALGVHRVIAVRIFGIMPKSSRGADDTRRQARTLVLKNERTRPTNGAGPRSGYLRERR